MRASKASPAIGTPSTARIVSAAIAGAARAGTEAHQTEVAGAAAEVADQHQLVVVEAALVLVGGGDRLVLEGDAPEAGLLGGAGQAGERGRVALGVDVAGGVDHEVHRPADQHGVAGVAELLDRGGPADR